MAFGMTQRERDALHFLRAYRATHGIFPTFEEIGDGLEVRSKSTITRLMRGLEARGHIRRLSRHARAIEIVTDQPDVVFANLDLPVRVQAQLTAFCEAHGEKPEDVIADALTLHFDAMETTLKKVVSR